MLKFELDYQKMVNILLSLIPLNLEKLGIINSLGFAEKVTQKFMPLLTKNFLTN